MAHIKTGLKCYTIDTDRYQDIRIKRLKKDYGCEGISVYDYILCEIYRVGGCYLDWNKETSFYVADYFDISENKVQAIVKHCAMLGLFDGKSLSRGILTSVSIQRRYTVLCVRTKNRKAAIPQEITLLKEKPAAPKKEEPVTAKPPKTMRVVVNDAPRMCEPYKLTLEQEIAELKRDECWLDQLQILHKMDMEKLRGSLDAFRVQCVADGMSRHESLQDAKHHFNNWLRIINNLKNRNNDTNKSNGRSQRRGNILNPDERKTYGGTF